jgi:ParB family chromosome partitioning protein
MNIVDIPVDQLIEASWNPNIMDDATEDRLKESVRRYGSVQNLVVRAIDSDTFEVIGGNHRLRVFIEQGIKSVPCVVVDVDDAHAKALAQALNRVQGTDDIGLKAQVFRDILSELSEEEVLDLLPETVQSLRDLQSLTQTDLADHLRAWDKVQQVKLRHLTFQVSDDQLKVVEQVLQRSFDSQGTHPSNPGARGNALYAICQEYLGNILPMEVQLERETSEKD